jgi:anti-sigma28 factor (negative regulator of flagellin synthesis)
MSSINSVNNSSPLQQVIANPIRKEVAGEPARSLAASSIDRLELSGVSQLLQSLKSNDVRTDKVAEMRTQIDAGTYETEERLNSAAEKLLDELLDK